MSSVARSKPCRKRFVVFTVIVGGYDTILQPAVIDDRFDYVVFSDLPIEDSGIWQVRPVDYVTDKNWLKARYPRLNTGKVLPEYEASLYIDGNIQILSQKVYERCIELNKQGVEWASVKHQGRDGLYNEINAIIGLGWVHDYDVLDWYSFMRKDNFPDDMGLYEDNIIFRRHTESVDKVNTIWWWSVEHFGFRRDQFSLMYALWKVPEIKTEYFLPENEDAWHNDNLVLCVTHNSHKRILDKTLWEKMRDRYVRKFYSSEGWEIYYTKWFDKLIKWPCPLLAMHLWTAWIALRYDLVFLLKRALHRVF